MNTRFAFRACTIACALTSAIAVRVAAQESLLPSASIAAAPSFSTWSLSTPLVQSAGNLKSLSQLALPLGARMSLGRVTVDLRAAFASSAATFEDNSGTEQKLSMSGLTDVRMRASLPVFGDAMIVTAGLNLPTGSTGLDAKQTTVAQVIGAPAFALGVPMYGIGFGTTLGVVAAREIGAWAFAVGGSFEQRAEYTPIEIALNGSETLTKVKPGSVMHVTLGADRVVGAHRVSLVAVGDVFSEDAANTGADATGFTPTTYKLGPQATVMAELALALQNWRSAGLRASVRHRGAFSDAAGATVTGSNANYMEASFGGVRGGAQGRGLIVGVDGRWHSGMTATDALVGAAVTAGGVTLGMEWPLAKMIARATARVQIGSFDTGTTKSNATGISLGMSLASRGSN